MEHRIIYNKKNKKNMSNVSIKNLDVIFNNNYHSTLSWNNISY